MRDSFNIYRTTLFFTLFIFFTSGVIGQMVFELPIVQNKDHEEEVFNKKFKDHLLVEFDVTELYNYVRSQPHNCPFQMKIGKDISWDIELHENEMRSADYLAQETGENGLVTLPRSECVTYAGQLSNDPNSVVRLNIDAHKVWGYVNTGGAVVYIEPTNRKDERTAAERYIIYDTKDVVGAEDHSCSAVARVERTIKDFSSDAQDKSSSLDCRKLDVATESDWEFYDDGETFSDILGNLNLVEGIYLGQFTMIFRVVYQHQWTTSNDPYTNSLSGCDGFGQLDEFTAYWSANFGHIRRDINVLYSEKEYTDGTTVGCAYTDSFGDNVDNDDGAYCVNEWLDDFIVHTESTRTVLIAHEMGHILGSNHTSTGIMKATLDSDATSFSSSSVTQIEEILTYEAAEDDVLDDGRSAIRTRYFPTTSPGDYFMVLPIPGNVSASEVILDENTVFFSGSSAGTFSFSATDKITLRPGFSTSAISGKNILIELGGCQLLGD